MTEIEYPLWKLLMLTSSSDEFIELSCSDCINLLDYDAGLLTRAGDLSDLLPVIKNHLSFCSNCRTELNSWLDRLGSKKNMQLIFRS